MSGAEALDFSGLFKLETIVQMEVVASCYSEVGSQKMAALAGVNTLEFIKFPHMGEKEQKTCDWDFVQHPIRCMCFEPTGTWLLLVSDCRLSLVPFLPLYEPSLKYDHRWSLTESTVIPFACDHPVAVSWWHTADLENIAVIALRCGLILFYSLDSKTLVGETRVPHEVDNIQISVDDSLDVLVLLITGSANHQWKLVLEHRILQYNWLREVSKPTTEVKEKKEGFMGYIKDKISNLSQGSSTEKDISLVEHDREPTDYLSTFKKGSHDWSLSVQYVSGRHFVTAFDLKVGTVILESTVQDTPSRTLRPSIKKEDRYRQALWCQRVLYLLTDNAVEVHSTSFAIQGSTEDDEEEDSLLWPVEDGPKEDTLMWRVEDGPKEDTLMWRVELPGKLQCAHLMTPRADSRRQTNAWQHPTFLCDLQLPRFPLETCLVFGSQGVYQLTTMLDPCEYVVGLIMRGGRGAERSAAALAAPVDTLLRSSADMLLSRSKLQPAKYLYDLSKSSPDGWVMRLGIFGFLEELACFTLPVDDKWAEMGGAAVVTRALAQLVYMATDHSCVKKFILDHRCVNANNKEMEELCYVAAALGLWEVVAAYSTHRGRPHLALHSVAMRRSVCLGALKFILTQKYLTMYLLHVNDTFLFDHLVKNCTMLSTDLLKAYCTFMSPLHEQLRPVLRNLKDGVRNKYTTRMQTLISAFMKIVCEIESREPTPCIPATLPIKTEPWKEKFVSKRTVSCGLTHWAISDGGDGTVMMASTPLKTALIGRVLSLACGRHHTIVLTENGVYAAGDNCHGQLGVGARWQTGVGEDACASGGLLYVAGAWDVRIKEVAAGHYHSAAIDSGGRLYTWGWGVHGQLGLGHTSDALKPRLVTRLLERKVLQVGCGACHTTVLTHNGEVFAFGASMFGQLGSGNRNKSSVPVQVVLRDDVHLIAVGYFHNLALTSTKKLWTWGASPQRVRAAATGARQAPSPPPPHDDTAANVHLQPQLVYMRNVRGDVLKMSAGWHHSCFWTHTGFIYTWGMNFDGQLGTGGRKHVAVPTLVEIPHEASVDEPNSDNAPRTSTSEYFGVVSANPDWTRNVEVACGGDFTVLVDDYGRIYIAGNTHEQTNAGKQSGRVIMMKTTRRVIKIPATRGNNKFIFQYFDHFDNLLTPCNTELEMIALCENPLSSASGFQRETWVDEIIHALKPWIEEDSVSFNLNVAAKLANHKQKYAECLRLQLENITIARELVRHRVNGSEAIVSENEMRIAKANHTVTTKLKDRIKEICRAFLNEQPVPEIASSVVRTLPCRCDDRPEEVWEIATDEEFLARKASKIVDDCLQRFPVTREGWEDYLRYARRYFEEHNLPGEELETVLNRYMERDAPVLGYSVLLPNDGTSYEGLLTPAFFLDLCSKMFEVQEAVA